MKTARTSTVIKRPYVMTIVVGLAAKDENGKYQNLTMGRRTIGTSSGDGYLVVICTTIGISFDGRMGVGLKWSEHH